MSLEARRIKAAEVALTQIKALLERGEVEAAAEGVLWVESLLRTLYREMK